MAQRSESFARLLKAGIGSIANCEGKTAPVIEDELGQQIGRAHTAIQRYKSGYLPPEATIVQALAEACVRRGLMGRSWLEQFLRAACYPNAQELADKLCPRGMQRERPPRVYENLPAPIYSQFVMREQAFAEVVDGLQQRSAVVMIIGLGGSGKTSLAREVAAHSLQADSANATFDAVVWVSDKDRPGTTNVSVLLDELARTLDYPGFTQLEHEEKQREIENLLRRQRVLVVVDNAETMTDGALVSWLLRLPEPSKALITTREYRREYRRGGWPVELRGMTDDEAQTLITQRLRVLKMERLVTDSAHVAPFIAVTGGNPKAIELSLGLIKYERRPLSQVVDDLYAARGELFDDLFSRAWALLDEAARRVLLAMPLFPDSASGDALSTTADVTGFAFDRAAERLTDLALLDVQQSDLDAPPRYALHALVRAFASARLAERPEYEQAARERWVGWYVRLTAQNDIWTDMSWPDRIEHEVANAFSALQWAVKFRHYSDVMRIGPMIGRYYSIRGVWDRNLLVRNCEVEAANALGDINSEVRALCNGLEIVALQGDMNCVVQYYERLEALINKEVLSPVITNYYRRSLVVYYLALDEVESAYYWSQHTLHPEEEHPPYALAWHLYLQGHCLYRKGMLDEAREAFSHARKEATERNYVRGMMFALVGLAAIALDCQQVETAASYLRESEALALRFNDRRLLAPIRRTFARLFLAIGSNNEARTALQEAIDLFSRIGMRRELAEARAELATLEAQLAAA